MLLRATSPPPPSAASAAASWESRTLRRDGQDDWEEVVAAAPATPRWTTITGLCSGPRPSGTKSARPSLASRKSSRWEVSCHALKEKGDHVIESSWTQRDQLREKQRQLHPQSLGEQGK
ncbi:hypothetical protein ZWY2020_049601 [Hordeum vulgare]|nr:hypothetical protein ZWY2020_049601 [Hordeum vulgare]